VPETQGDQGGSWWSGLAGEAGDALARYRSTRERTRTPSATNQNNQAVAVPGGSVPTATLKDRTFIDSLTEDPSKLLMVSVALLVIALAVKKFAS
jgi:hypothetical protein